MLIDTHCHLDAAEFDPDRTQVIERARASGVASIVIPAVHVGGFAHVQQLAHSIPGAAYALGIHPLYVPQSSQDDLVYLEQQIKVALSDPRFVAIGEIGLDFFVPELKTAECVKQQEFFYQAQLNLARRYGLPVLLHVRRSQDRLLKYLRAGSQVGGIAHAFNGSEQQARQFMNQGFALGFGGTVTFERSLQIRRLAQSLPLDALVLETDAPDIPPAWLGTPGHSGKRNEPAQVARIAQVLATLRGVPTAELVKATAHSAFRVLPRLHRLLSAEPLIAMAN